MATLFDEAGIAFAIKKFGSADFKAMVVAKDKNHVYRFLFKSNDIEIIHDAITRVEAKGNEEIIT